MVTIEEAIDNAARLLQAAESETNLALMERLEKLADSWLAMTNVLIVREQMRS